MMEPSTISEDPEERNRLIWHDHMLYKLSMKRWDLTKVPTTLRFPNLGHLELNSNQITEVPDFQDLPNLEFLCLQFNRLTSVPDFSGIPKLKKLFLQSNFLETVPDFQHLPNLEWLNLSHNNLTTIPRFSKLSKLHWINIDDNRIWEDHVSLFKNHPCLFFLIHTYSFKEPKIKERSKRVRFRINLTCMPSDHHNFNLPKRLMTSS